MLEVKLKENFVLKSTFILGAVIDCGIAISWFLIAAGWQIPNILNGYTGSGADYRLAMYIAAMFMAGWTTLLAWGALKPMERKDLLLITSGFLLFSVVIELLVFSHVLSGYQFILGIIKRLTLSGIFASIYFYSSKKPALTNK